MWSRFQLTLIAFEQIANGYNIVDHCMTTTLHMYNISFHIILLVGKVLFNYSVRIVWSRVAIGAMLAFNALESIVSLSVEPSEFPVIGPFTKPISCNIFHAGVSDVNVFY